MSAKPWLDHYPKEVAKQIDPKEFTSLAHLLSTGVESFSDSIAFENFGKGITYKELDKRTQDFASYLTNCLGLKKGDRIALQMPNLLQYPIAMFGALRAGLIVVNTNPLYTADEMQHQFRDSGAKAVVIYANFAHNLQKILSRTDIEHVIVTETGDQLGGLKGTIVNFVVKYVKKMVPSFSLPDAVSFNSALKQGSKHGFQDPDLTLDDLAFLQYTGGTTGVAKGAMLTHGNLVANCLQIKQWFMPKLSVGNEVVITPLPLYHVFALTANCLAMYCVGAKNILITNPRDLPAFIKDLKKYPFTLITGVNTLFNALLNHESIDEVDFSHMKLAVGGGMAVQQAVTERWKTKSGNHIVEGYGLTETSPVLCCNPTDDNIRIGSIGLPLPSTEIILVDDDGNEVEPGTPGELCAKGPQVMRGYWQQGAETEKCFHDGWLKTGDIAVMDEDGFFKIVDRKKEMINVSGFKVFPNDVEDTVALNEKVLEVGCIGVPDDRSNEVVKIFVVKKDPSLSEDELHDFCKQHMTGYKRPKYIEFRSELPKTNIGKILRRKLKEEEANKA